jgi:hypothetical protein
MNFTTPEKKIRSIYNTDPDFIIDDGIIMAPRAGFQISKDCPKEYELMFRQATHNGWIKPIAYMKETEYMWEVLNK